MAKESETDSAVVARLELLKRLGERAVRRYVGCNLVQATYTHILPAAGLCLRNQSRRDIVQATGSYRGGQGLGEILRLPEWPVRSITSLYEDTAAYGGSVAGSFSADDLLTSGEDYYLAVDQSGLSWFGHVVRIGLTWAAIPGSVKVIYVAGWSAAELDGDVTDPRLDASDIKLAVLKTIAESWNRTTQQSDGGGRLVSEKIDDYFVQYASGKEGESSVVDLPSDSKMLLAPFKRRTI
jgi:hypothetical protein